MKSEEELALDLARRLGLKPKSFTVRHLMRLPEWAFPEAFCRRVLNRAGRVHGHAVVSAAYVAAGGRYSEHDKTRRIGLYANELRDCVLRLPVACKGIGSSCAEERESA